MEKMLEKVAITRGKKYTARELAERFGCDTDTITKHANALFGKGAGRGKTRYFDEAQTTAILERIKTPTPSGHQATSATVAESVETTQSLDLQIAITERKAKELWKRKSLEQEARAVQAEMALSLNRELLEERETGLEFYQRAAEAGGLVLGDRDDITMTYRR